MKKQTPLFLSAKKFYDLGFSILWLHRESKRPIETGWTKGARKPWDYYAQTYLDGFNVGVRLGAPSRVGGKYLAVIDCDVKSTDPRHEKEMLKALDLFLVGQPQGAVVMSGRGNGSRHVYVRTEAPLEPFLAARSPESVHVLMPSARPSKFERTELSPALLDAGTRIRKAWEISVMGTGQQTVLPPSVHPDSKKPYRWAGPGLKLPVVRLEKPQGDAQGVRTDADRGEIVLGDFKPEEVDLGWLDLPQDVFLGITTGEGPGAEDRSAYLMRAAFHLARAGLSHQQVLSVLTDPAHYLGQTGYDHAKTSDRGRAAAWVWKYTVKKAFEDLAAQKNFDAVSEELVADCKAVAAMIAEPTGFEKSWKDELERSKEGALKQKIRNALRILRNTVEGGLRHDLFADEFRWMLDTPWGTKAGDRFTDLDLIRFKEYVAKNHNGEFTQNLIMEAMTRWADENRFHPVRDWLNTLEWDGVPRLNTWLVRYAGAEDKGQEAYVAEVSRRVLIAMVKRVMEPGCKFDSVLILEGVQGAGKSSLARALAGEWFTDEKIVIGDKDSILSMIGNWVVELGELSALRKSDLEDLKAFISRPTDRIRKPYARTVGNYDRQSIFIGTTNGKDYLKDITGARRFWPIKVCDNVNWKGFNKVRDQIFAEAFTAHGWGEDVWIVGEDAKAQAVEAQEARRQRDELENLIGQIITEEKFKTPFTLSELGAHHKLVAMGGFRMDYQMQRRLGAILKLQGFEGDNHRIAGFDSPVWSWKRVVQ